ncbi:protein arginine N-methyltransferase 8-like isoform X2 [Branchiostoma floridae]|uniref:type I protein arginine methyltransferase n=1 Tax=Branchiostoma floridae TaxID=7739 RepID=A0A9J7KN45_BRAFL|nr:protein arginine N-methyltransferase 8-like isoform X2 [Branchiostoma floridae]
MNIIKNEFTYGEHEDHFFNQGFNAYCRPDIQQGMLEDEVRTKFYRDAIYNNKHLFKDKIVMDFGCGSGILSMFAAKAGAKKVFGVEASNLAKTTKKNVKKNGLDHIITILEGKVEEIELPGVDKVDILLSEVMGVGLIHEGTLQSLVIARDRFLKPGGILFPDKNTLYICAIEDKKMHDKHVTYWKDVNGYGMNAMADASKSYAWHHPIRPQQPVTDYYTLREYDWNTCKLDDIFFASSFKLKCNRKDTVHSLAVFFDCEFSACSTKTVLSTGPEAPMTHWMQLTCHLDEPVEVDKGEELEGTFAAKAYNGRDLEFNIDMNFKGTLGSTKLSREFYFYWGLSSQMPYKEDEH